jgi:hypothetical protein
MEINRTFRNPHSTVHLTPTSEAVLLNGTNSNHFSIAATIPGKRNRTNGKECTGIVASNFI